MPRNLISDSLSYREMNLCVFAGEPIPHVFFQPRLEAWFFWHKTFDSFPQYYRGKDLIDLYDDLGASNRYFSSYTGLPEPIETQFAPAVHKTETVRGEVKTTCFDTPYGELIEKRLMTVDRIWRKTEFAVKTSADLDKLKWLYENSAAHFNADVFAQGKQLQGDRGETQFWVSPSPYAALTFEWMRFEDFIYALVDIPDQMKDVMQAIDRSYDQMFEEILTYGAVKIINFGENVHALRMPPSHFEAYLIPWYEKRSNQLRRSGIYTHIHIDGDCKPLLRYLNDLPFDGLEALTPLPQGDVTLEEIKAHIGDKVLLDGIPAILFMDHYPRAELQECVEKLVKYFHPRLVLGISDELPQGGNEESIERVRWVAEYCRSTRSSSGPDPTA